MKTIKILLALFFFVAVNNIYSQEISFEPLDTFLYDVPGTEIIFEIEVTNLTDSEQYVFMVRTENTLPAEWTSSLCFDLCFADFVDSIATTFDYGSTPLMPQETRIVSLHVFSNQTVGTSYVQLQAGTFHNPDNRITHDFTATTDPSVNVNEEIIPAKYSLSQNYPNPFNPSTKINFSVKEAGLVTLRVYNILGVEISTLINEYRPAGVYSIPFNAAKLSSGVYIYHLTVNGFTQTRKMILEK